MFEKLSVLPIWQAPIGSVASTALAAAVANAGGVGALALSCMEPEETRRSVKAVLSQTDGALQGNFVLTFPTTSLGPALESGLRVVTFSWGLPQSEISVVRSFGAQIGIQVTSALGARRALDLGIDFLICQGVEAGGHVQATRSLWKVLPEVLTEAKRVPVVAAGGIASGIGMARALGLGASGAMLGTRFVATIESLAHEAYKQRIVEAGSADAVLTVCFDGGWPHAAHRVIRNATLDAWEAAGCPRVGRRPGENDVTGTFRGGRTFVRYEDAPPQVGMSGAPSEMCLYAGLGCDEITDIPHAGDLVARLWTDCVDYRRRGANHV